jgi:hypothetical protein
MYFLIQDIYDRKKINLKLDKIARIKFHFFMLMFGSVIVFEM